MMQRADMSIVDLRREARPIGGDIGRVSVPEHVVKLCLHGAGVETPQGATTQSPNELHSVAESFTEPLVLKAFGAGLLHKSDMGAVELGLRRTELTARALEMAARVEAAGGHAEGFVVEEQIPAGVELLLGVVRRDPYGLLVVLGLGGTLTELATRSSARIFPLRRADAEELVAELPAAALAGARTGVPIDRRALVEVLLKVAGIGGLVSGWGTELDEFECNPLIVTGDRVVAADGRLILRDVTSIPESRTYLGRDLSPLYSPETIAVAGASTSKYSFGNRFLASYRAAGWTDGLYAVHPTAESIDGVPAVADLVDIPGGVDYLLSAVPAERTSALLRSGAGIVKFAQVVTGGFGEAGERGAVLEREVADTAASAGIRVLGPNCMGVYSPVGRQTFILNSESEPGPTGVVSQSGSLASEIVLSGLSRGVRFSKLATLGNAVDVTPGEMTRWLLTDQDTRLIGMYLEGVRDDDFIDAVRAAQGRVPIVALVGGLSDQGSVAVASHTGAMAGETRVWQALSSSYGITVVSRLEHLLASLSYLQCHLSRIDGAVPPSTLVIGPGGGASVLATDTFDAYGVPVTPSTPELRASLAAHYGTGTSTANPMEIPVGPGSPVDAIGELIGNTLEVQQFSDVIVHLNVQSWYAFSNDGVASMVELIEAVGRIRPYRARLGLVIRSADAARNSDSGVLREACSAVGLTLFRDFDEAAVSVAAAQRFDRHFLRRNEWEGE
ncbi:acetate--CoA ligase family protein [Rhodococcus sp. IEGM1428]|uniref:acetate--CoA ligase family protein n=1 Tax=Rhodococcus sp. IEGM1428 TaxID=3392191 RepID=UPI003D0AB115